MFQPQKGEQKFLFIRVIYPDDNTVILSDERAPLHAQAFKTLIETNSYGTLTIDIDITPILMMPQSSFTGHQYRITGVDTRYISRCHHIRGNSV